MCAYEHMPKFTFGQGRLESAVCNFKWLVILIPERWVHILVIRESICVLMSRTVVHNQV